MAMKPKPKGWNAMSKAKQDAWKKANYSSATKVTTAQLDKLRAAKTPAAAIAKYKNDPAMREALNRFYGKAKVSAAGGSAAPAGPGSGGENSGRGTGVVSSTRGGPGAKPRPPRSATATATSTSSKPKTYVPAKGAPARLGTSSTTGKPINSVAAIAGAAAVGALVLTKNPATAAAVRAGIKSLGKGKIKIKLKTGAKHSKSGTPSATKPSTTKPSTTKPSTTKPPLKTRDRVRPDLAGGTPRLDEAKLRRILGKQ